MSTSVKEWIDVVFPMMNREYPEKNPSSLATIRAHHFPLTYQSFFPKSFQSYHWKSTSFQRSCFFHTEVFCSIVIRFVEGIKCDAACKKWLERGQCTTKWRRRCLRTCLALGCDDEPVRPEGKMITRGMCVCPCSSMAFSTLPQSRRHILLERISQSTTVGSLCLNLSSEIMNNGC